MVPFVEAEAVVTSPAQSNVQRVQRVIVIYIMRSRAECGRSARILKSLWMSMRRSNRRPSTHFDQLLGSSWTYELSQAYAEAFRKFDVDESPKLNQRGWEFVSIFWYIFTSSIDYKVVSSQTLMDIECYFESRFVPGIVIFAEAGCQGFPISQISHDFTSPWLVPIAIAMLPAF